MSYEDRTDTAPCVFCGRMNDRAKCRQGFNEQHLAVWAKEISSRNQRKRAKNAKLERKVQRQYLASGKSPLRDRDGRIVFPYLYTGDALVGSSGVVLSNSKGVLVRSEDAEHHKGLVEDEVCHLDVHLGRSVGREVRIPKDKGLDGPSSLSIRLLDGTHVKLDLGKDLWAAASQVHKQLPVAMSRKTFYYWCRNGYGCISI